MNGDHTERSVRARARARLRALYPLPHRIWEGERIRGKYDEDVVTGGHLALLVPVLQ